MNPLLRACAYGAIRHSGLESGLRAWQSRSLRLLTYHKFTSPLRDLRGSLEKQLAHLRKYYQVITLSEGVDCLKDGRPLPKKAVAVTIDDGYRDYLTEVRDLFDRYQVPVTIYLISECASRNHWMWYDRVEHILLNLDEPELRVQTPDDRELFYPLRTIEERLRAADKLCPIALRWSTYDRAELLRSLADLAGAPLPAIPAPRYRFLSFDEIRRLDGDGVEFGCHTSSHPILSSITSNAERVKEIVGSRRMLEAELGHPVRHFCFPNGGPTDYTEQDLQIIENSGYDSAATLHSGLNRPGADLYRLRRINMSADMAEENFRVKVAQIKRLQRSQECNLPLPRLSPHPVTPSLTQVAVWGGTRKTLAKAAAML